MLMKKVILILIIIFTFTKVSYAQEIVFTPKAEKINPNSSLFLFKRAFEKIRGKIIFSQEKKINFEGKLLEKRLSELNYLVNNKKLTPLETASQRFSAQAGIYIDALNKNGLSYKENVLEDFKKYNILLSKLRDNFPANDAYWLLLQQNIDTLNILSDKL